MKKLQQFTILKIDSTRLKDCNFKIKELTLDQARLNGEVIQISNSQLVRTLHRITGKVFSQEKLESLLSEKSRLSKKKNNKDIRNQLSTVLNEIDSLLFIPELISVKFQDRRHFQNIVNKGGFLVNGKNYIFLFSSAGQTRRDTSLFVDATIKEHLMSIFENGRDTTVPLVIQKFQAYLSLYSSSSMPIRFPRIAVAKDIIIKAKKKVDFSYYVSQTEDPIFRQEEKELELNGADGQGLMSPEFAQMMADDLGLDYLPASAIVRASFLKGLLVTFPIHEFADKIAKKKTFVDIYGNEINIKDVDCIISESQFKLWNCYKSTDEYIKNCEKNGLGFGVSRVSPKTDRVRANSSYQFLQILDIKTQEQVEQICSPTVNWLKDVSGGDIFKSLLFMLGETSFERGWFEKLSPLIRALLLENELINDSYFTENLSRSLAKKKNDAKFGRLCFRGNYQFALADPYAQMSHVMGMEITPLLNDKEHYSEFWNSRGVSEVACVRSPVTHASEVDVLNFKNNEKLRYWFRFLNTGLVFPLYGIGMDCAILGGQDHDGDSDCTIDNRAFLESKFKDTLPILYNVKKPPKTEIKNGNEPFLVQSQIKQIGTNKIGYVTNLASSMYSLLYSFPEGSIEYNTILNRLKYFRILQGNLIDATKGVEVDPPLLHWDKFIKITDDMNNDERKKHNFDNSILGNVRPFFMKYLYQHYRKRYNKEIAGFNNISTTKFGIAFSELLVMENKTEEQQKLVDWYHKKTFFINNDSPMNKISHHMERELEKIKITRRESSKNFDYTILLSKNFREPLKRDVEKARLLYKEYKSLKRSISQSHREFDEKDYSSVEQVYKYINAKAYKTITSNASEMANLMVYLCYKILGKQSKSFCWSCFGEEIFSNIKEKKNQKFVRVPVPDEKGNIDYLFQKHAIHLINIED